MWTSADFPGKIVPVPLKGVFLKYLLGMLKLILS